MERTALPRPRRFHLPRRTPYPIWSVTSVCVVGVVIAIGVASALFFASDRPLLVELEWSAAILSACLFLFLTVGLYRGVRLRKERFAWPTLPKTEDWGGQWSGDAPDLTSLADGDEFFGLGVVVGLILSLLLMLLIVLLLPFLVPIVYGAVALVGLCAWWLCYLALRRVFVLSKRTRGDLPASLGYALLYTALYTGWLLVVLGVWHYTTVANTA